MSPLEAARDLDLGRYTHLREPERLVANINALYKDFGADVAVDPVTVMRSRPPVIGIPASLDGELPVLAPLDRPHSPAPEAELTRFL